MTLSKTILRLEELKLLKHTKNENDARSVMVSLTNYGQKIISQAVNQVKKKLM